MKQKIAFIVLFFVAVSSTAFSQQKEFMKVNKLIKEQKTEEAFALTDSIISAYPGFFDAYEFKVSWMVYWKYYESALETLGSYLKNAPENDNRNIFMAHVEKAEIFKKMQQKDSVATQYEKAITLAKYISDKSDMLQLAGAYNYLGRYDDARNALLSALAKSPDDIKLLNNIGLTYIFQSDPAGAKPYAERALAIDSLDALAHFVMGAYYDGTKEYDKALRHFATNITITGNFWSYSTTAFEEVAGKDVDAALDILNKKIEENDNIGWYAIRAKVFSNNYNYPEAYNDYTEYLKNAPVNNNLYHIYYQRGRLGKDMGLFDSSIKDFEIYLEQYEDNKYALIEIGDCYRLKADFEKAIEYFTLSIQADSTYYFPYYRRGWCKEYVNDWDGALADYNKAIGLAPEYAYTYLHRGRLYEGHLKDKKKAKADYKKILELETEPRDMGNCRQYALMHLGKNKEASEYMDKIIETFPNDAGNYYDAACMYSLMGKPDKAIQNMELAFEHGFRDFYHVKTDDDVDAIRDLPEFKKIYDKWFSVYQKELEKLSAN